MNATAEDFRQHYAGLSDEGLLEIDPDELVEVARNCLEEEIAKRGLNDAAANAGQAGEESPFDPGSGEDEEPICVAEFDTPDEADSAKMMLDAEEIPARLESDGGTVRLMVERGLADTALRLLMSEALSEEELAAQAEAATPEGEEPEEELEEEPE
jgi:hypothetical protein